MRVCLDSFLWMHLQDNEYCAFLQPPFCSAALQGNNGRCVMSDEPAAPVRGQYASIILCHFIGLHLDDRYPGYLIVSQIPAHVNKHKHKRRSRRDHSSCRANVSLISSIVVSHITTVHRHMSQSSIQPHQEQSTDPHLGHCHYIEPYYSR